MDAHNVADNSAPLLRGYKMFASKSPEEVRAFMHDVGMFLDLRPREAAALDVESRVASLPGSRIGYIRYGSATTVGTRHDCRPPDDIWLHFPVRGNSELVAGASEFECGPARSGVLPAGFITRSAPDSERVTLTISKATVIRQLSALLGDQPAGRLEFLPKFDLEAPHGRMLRRQVYLAIAGLDEAGPAAIGPVMLNMYEQLIVTQLLLGQPSNYTAALQRLEGKNSPGDVKRAIDFIEGHLRLPLTLTDIAMASGVPGRTLLEHFRHHRGVSPMRYLRDARFAKVRDALSNAQGTESVTQIAMEWGFNHLGRFAVEYREQFGESPSETLRRCGL